MSATQGVLIAAAAAGGVFLLLSSQDTSSARDVENPVTVNPPVNYLPAYGEPGYENPAIAQPPQTYDPYEEEIPMPEPPAPAPGPGPSTALGSGPGTCMLNGTANPQHGTKTYEYAHHSPDSCFTFHSSMFHGDGYSPWKNMPNGVQEMHLGYKFHDGMYVTPTQGTTLVPSKVATSGQQLYTVSPTDLVREEGDPVTAEQVAAWTHVPPKPCNVSCPSGYAPAFGLGANGQPNFWVNGQSLSKADCKAQSHAQCMHTGGGRPLFLMGHNGIYHGNERIVEPSYPPDMASFF